MMVKWFWQVLRDTVREITHGRLPLAVLLVGTPIFFTLLFGAVYEANVINDVPLVIYDQDQSSLSRQLIQAYEDSDKFVIVANVTSEEELEEQLAAGKALAALEIPEDFSKEVRSGRGKDVLLMVNSVNNMYGNSALTASMEIARSFSVAVGQRLLEGLNLLPSEAMNAAYPVHLGVRILGNPTNGYVPFMLAGLMMNGLQIGLMVSFAPVLVIELERKKYSACPNGIFILASAVGYILFSLLGYLISLGILIYYYAVPMHGSWLDAFILGVSFLFFVAGVLSLFASCCPTKELALQAPMVYIMPGVLYSGLSWPVFDMNSVAEAFGKLLPMTYAGDSLRDIMLLGYTPQLAQNVLVMLGAGLLTGSIATGIFTLRRQREKKKAEVAGG